MKTLKCIAFFLRSLDWQAVAAIGTFLAVIVALIPIFLNARREKAQARNLRVRFGTKLLNLRPSIANILLGTQRPTVLQSAVLSSTDFRQVVWDLNSMMSIASVLKPDEHDQLGVTLINLGLAASLYGTKDLTPQSAKNILGLIDSTLKLFEKNGLLVSKVSKPWSYKSNTRRD